MASLFSDDPRPPAGRAPFRKFPSRSKASPTELPPLPPGWILAHCDGGARGNPGPAGFGAVLVDAEGTPLGELSEFLGFRTNNYAEYSGLLAVLAFALEHGHPKLRVISDSELMVKQVQGKYKVNSPDLRPLFEEARRRIARLEAFEVHHALRHKNKVADRLANEAMDRGMGKGTGATAATEAPRAIPYPREPTPGKPVEGKSSSKQGSDPVAGLNGATEDASNRVSTARPESPAMLRGFVRDGVIHLLGSSRLPENSFVKILPE